jgi:jumonji domain-containing protein 7
MRYVACNRPFVVRRGASQWHAVQTWTSDYLKSRIGHCRVKVAITPNGYEIQQPLAIKVLTPSRNADAPLKLEDGSLWFVEPKEEYLPFNQVLAIIQNQEASRQGDLSFSCSLRQRQCDC